MIQSLITRINPAQLLIKWWSWALLILAAIFAVYGFVLNGPFIWDDEVMVVTNTLIRSLGNIGQIFTTSAFGEPFHPSLFYRPMQILSFAVDYQFWGLNPLGYRLTSVIFHWGNAVLVLLIFRRFFSPILAGMLAVIFAVHPIAIECVTYISGRGDVMSTGLALGSILLVLHYTGDTRLRWLMGAVGCYLIALVTKENIVFVPFIWLACDYLFSAERSRISRWMIWGSVAVSILFSAFRYLGSLDSKSRTLSFIAEASFFDRVLTFPRIILTYLKLSFWPVPLHMEYHFVTTSIWNLSLWIGMPILVIGVWFWLKKSVLRTILFWFILIAVVGILPVNNVVPALASTVREHWFYLSLVGVLGCVGVAITQVKEKFREVPATSVMVYGFLFLGIAVLGGITFDRNLDWKDPIRFYQHDIACEPKGFVLYNNLGVELFRAGQVQDAGIVFQKAIETSPGHRYGIAYNNLGAVFLRSEDVQSAEALFRASIALSDYPLAYRNLIAILYTQQRLDELAVLVNQAVQHHPDQIDFAQMRDFLQK